MIGSVAYANPSRRFALIAPAGKTTRSHEFYAAEIWWHVAGLDLPYVGQIVEFDLATNADGYVEAVTVTIPKLPPPGRSTLDGAEPALPVRVGHGSAGIFSGRGQRP